MERGTRIPQRGAARLELVKFLLDSGDNTRAQAELITLAVGLPRNPQLEMQAGTLMLRAGGYDHALKLFRQVRLWLPCIPTSPWRKCCAS